MQVKYRNEGSSSFLLLRSPLFCISRTNKPEYKTFIILKTEAQKKQIMPWLEKLNKTKPTNNTAVLIPNHNQQERHLLASSSARASD